MKKLMIAGICLTLALMLITGCASKPVKPASPSEKPDQTTAPIDTEDQRENSYQYDLYFGFENSDYLVAQRTTIKAANDISIEQMLLEALIAGPASGEGVERLIDSSTVVRSIQPNNGCLFVVFSSEFTNPVGMPENWESDDELKALVQKRRQMAVWSVVNTLTELGRYSKVQILLDLNGDGTGQRVSRYDLGFSDDPNDTTRLEPLARNDAVIYDAEVALHDFIRSLDSRDYDRAAQCVATLDGSERPDNNALTASFSGADLTFLTYALISCQVSSDGLSALILIDYELQSGNRTDIFKDIPIRMIREGGYWRVSYNSAVQLLEGGAS